MSVTNLTVEIGLGVSCLLLTEQFQNSSDYYKYDVYPIESISIHRMDSNIEKASSRSLEIRSNGKLIAGLTCDVEYNRTSEKALVLSSFTDDIEAIFEGLLDWMTRAGK